MRMHRSFAPGRVELLGNHTDYNDGYVLSAAINLGITMEGDASADAVIKLASSDAGAHVEIDDSKPLAPAKGNTAWSNYVVGIVNELREAGHRVGAFSATIESTVPTGAGLSSSAALEVATATLLSKINGISMPPMELAKLCRRSENRFVGVNCGLLDQASSVFGKKDHAVFLDCLKETVENIPFPAGYSLLISHSNVKHSLVGGEYNERREQCMEAARILGVPALRYADFALLEAGRDKMSDVVYRRAKHVVGENTRVLAALEHLRAGDAKAFGRLMFESHESSRVNFENSTHELDILVEAASRVHGITGARLTGGGFGGAIISLVETSHADAAAEAIADAYRTKTGHQCSNFICQPFDGAH